MHKVKSHIHAVHIVHVRYSFVMNELMSMTRKPWVHLSDFYRDSETNKEGHGTEKYLRGRKIEWDTYGLVILQII